MGEVFEFEAKGDSKDLPENKKDDIGEILNYRKAMQHAVKLLKKLPLCQRVVKNAHKVLLTGVQGQGKSLGRIQKNP